MPTKQMKTKGKQTRSKGSTVNLNSNFPRKIRTRANEKNNNASPLKESDCEIDKSFENESIDPIVDLTPKEQLASDVQVTVTMTDGEEDDFNMEVSDEELGYDSEGLDAQLLPADIENEDERVVVPTEENLDETFSEVTFRIKPINTPSQLPPLHSTDLEEYVQKLVESKWKEKRQS